MKDLPKISIVIPTYNSESVLKDCLEGIKNQNYPDEKLEIIVVDNGSSDNTVNLAKEFGAFIHVVGGAPPQVCVQRNLGIEKSSGDYVYILDHDMKMSDNLLLNFAKKNCFNKDIDTWYVPERIASNNKFWSIIRTFERSFYNGTVVDAVRIIKKSVFNSGLRYDVNLSSGPADWDFDNQLKVQNYKFGIIDNYIDHYEKYAGLKKYLFKKAGWNKGGDFYREKWRNSDVYDQIVKKQYSAFYRLFKVFVEDGKWRKLILKFYLFIPMISLRFLVGFIYLFSKKS